MSQNIFEFLIANIDHALQATDGIGGSPGLATQLIGKVSSTLVESVNTELSQVCICSVQILSRCEAMTSLGVSIHWGLQVCCTGKKWWYRINLLLLRFFALSYQCLLTYVDLSVCAESQQLSWYAAALSRGDGPSSCIKWDSLHI